jgi:hypothetical protein
MTSDLIVIIAGSVGSLGTVFAVVRDWVARHADSGKKREIRIEVNGKNFSVNTEELDDAQIEALIQSIIENRPETGSSDPGKSDD